MNVCHSNWVYLNPNPNPNPNPKLRRYWNCCTNIMIFTIQGGALWGLALSITVVSSYFMVSILQCMLGYCRIFHQLSLANILVLLSPGQASSWCHQCRPFHNWTGFWTWLYMGCFCIEKGCPWPLSAFGRATVWTCKPPSGCTSFRSVWGPCSVGQQYQKWPISFFNFLFWCTETEQLLSSFRES